MSKTNRKLRKNNETTLDRLTRMSYSVIHAMPGYTPCSLLTVVVAFHHRSDRYAHYIHTIDMRLYKCTCSPRHTQTCTANAMPRYDRAFYLYIKLIECCSCINICLKFFFLYKHIFVFLPPNLVN